MTEAMLFVLAVVYFKSDNNQETARCASMDVGQPAYSRRGGYFMSNEILDNLKRAVIEYDGEAATSRATL